MAEPTRDQKSEVRGQRSEVRDQRSETSLNSDFRPLTSDFGEAGALEPGWQRVLVSAALLPGKLAKALVAGREILLARLDDGTLAAADVVCPHQGADLSEGMIYLDAVDCPLHHYLYDLRTGENRYPRDVFPAHLKDRLAPLRLFPVKEEDGWIWVSPDYSRKTI
jgi:3-phenylpropionate/trans-cinnamate dioxygenase ferredoxin subunit